MDKNEEISMLFSKLRKISKDFGNQTGEYDIYTNSKFYEIVIANYFGHTIIKGHSGTFDAKTIRGKQLEYKHFKASSSNHTWTFNDYSIATLEKLKNADVYFVYIDDIESYYLQMLKWYYIVSGEDISNYILSKTASLQNTRKMINISAVQLENYLKVKKIKCFSSLCQGKYSKYLEQISSVISHLEVYTGTSHLLTSNKLWELFLAWHLGHQINSQQGGYAGTYDAFSYNQIFEYKISTKNSWCFEDLSENVIDRLQRMDNIIVAVIDKRNFKVEKCYWLDSKKTAYLLWNKLQEKRHQYFVEQKELRRQNITLTENELIKSNLIISLPTG